jgi:hypothetical protein
MAARPEESPPATSGTEDGVHERMFLRTESNARRDHPVRIRAQGSLGAGARSAMWATGITFVGAEDNGVISAVS